MNRNTEYDALLAELEPTPPALEYTVQRALTSGSWGYLWAVWPSALRPLCCW